MPSIGSEQNPLRVAIIGAGPAAFYTAAHLQKETALHVKIDMFDLLPTPFGLVRTGVAPDHQKYKSVQRVYDKTARHPGFRFFGSIAFGEHIHLGDLKRFYHQIVFATGTALDRKMNVLGEDLKGSYSATDFIAWYNGHPDYAHYEFDLSGRRAAVIGVGNVALDVARILCKPVTQLATTDMADYALEALAKSRIEEVYILGRRGPAQAVFSPPELREMDDIEATDIIVSEADATLDPLSEIELQNSKNKAQKKNVAIIKEYATRPIAGRARRLNFRFLVAPTEIKGDESGKVASLKLSGNELYDAGEGNIRPRPTGEHEILPIDAVFRSVGYLGTPLPGIPFDEWSGTIANENGRIGTSEEILTGLYTAGWIKRGPTGVIGTNRKDALETVGCMLADLRQNKLLMPENPDTETVLSFVQEKNPRFISYDDWLVIDAAELARGSRAGRDRVKFTSVEEMLQVLGK